MKKWFSRLLGSRDDIGAGNSSAAPPWTASFSLEKQRLLVHEITEYFRKHATSSLLSRPIKGLPTAQEQQRLGLLTLAQACQKRPVSEWADVVENHFVMLEQIAGEAREIEAKVTDFNAVRERLVVQIAAKDTVQTDGLCWREDLPGLVTYLAFDLRSGVRIVRPADAACWGKPRDELFAIALANLWAKPKPEGAGLQLGDSATCLKFDSTDLFAATFALFLDRHPQTVGASGSIVAVPTRHVLLCMPIVDGGAAKSAVLLERLTNLTFDKGPGPISRKLFWYRNGWFVELKYTTQDQRLTFDGPPEFLQMLGGLPEKASAGNA